MDWMRVSLRRQGRNVLLLGAVAGIWGTFVYYAAHLLASLMLEPVPSSIIAGSALGLGLCATLAAVNDLAQRFWGRALWSGAIGAALGLILGAGGFAG